MGSTKKRLTFAGMVQWFDAYGKQVNLTLKGETTKKTIIGGLATLLSRLVIVVYFCYEMIGVYQKDSTIKTTVRNIDIEDTSIRYQINSSQFDFGLVLESLSDNETIQSQYYRYLTIGVENIYFYWEKQEDGPPLYKQQTSQLELEPCQKGRFNNDSDYAETIGLYDYYLCMKDPSFEIFGQDQANSTRALRITIDGCIQEKLDYMHPGVKCEDNPAEVSKAIRDLDTSITFMSQYFDGEIFGGTALKNYYRMDYFTLNEVTSLNYFIKVSQNKVIKHDSWLSSQLFLEEEEYLSLRYDNFFEHAPEQFTFPYLSIILEMDEQVSTSTRQVKTILEALSNTGGIMEFIFVAIGFSIMYFQDFAYNSTIMSKIFIYDRSPEKVKYGQIQSFTEDAQVSGDDHIQQQESNISTVDDMIKSIMPLYRQIINRIPFKITFKEYCFQRFGNSLRCCCCWRRKNANWQSKKKLYDAGLRLLKKELDVAQIVKKLRAFKITQTLFFSKYQRFMFPYFKTNLLRDPPGIDNSFKILKKKANQSDIQNKILQYFLQVLVQYKHGSVKDKAIAERLVLDKQPSVTESLPIKMLRGILKQHMLQQLGKEKSLLLSSSEQVKKNQVMTSFPQSQGQNSSIATIVRSSYFEDVSTATINPISQIEQKSQVLKRLRMDNKEGDLKLGH